MALTSSAKAEPQFALLPRVQHLGVNHIIARVVSPRPRAASDGEQCGEHGGPARVKDMRRWYEDYKSLLPRAHTPCHFALARSNRVRAGAPCAGAPILSDQTRWLSRVRLHLLVQLSCTSGAALRALQTRPVTA
jgi:hypothetical protein